MITATPPAYDQVCELDDERRLFSSYSDDAKEADSMLLSSIQHLRSTPASAFAASFYDDYQTPPPQAKRKMKVNFKFRGAGAPIPFDEDLED